MDEAESVERKLIERMRSRILLALLRIIEIHEHSIDTSRHADRVASVSNLVGMDIGLPMRERAVLWRCSLIHDLGKVGVLSDILGGNRKLTKHQRYIVQNHPKWGADILNILDIYRYEAIIVKQHHEDFDGNGYPDNLIGKNIHLYARIIHTVDVYDALTMFRGYKKQWRLNEAIKYIYKQSGKMFDPDVVKIFMRIVETDEFRRIYT